MPRSLLACTERVLTTLERLADCTGSRRGECHRRAGEIHARLRDGRIDTIFQEGLHEFVTRFVDDSILLGREISEFYLFA
jgi:uncharacterized alpha-E superfamily protein